MNPVVEFQITALFLRTLGINNETNQYFINVNYSFRL